MRNITNGLWLSVAMLAFAANSLLCRMALLEGSIDPASFTSIRLISGAFTLFLLTYWNGIRAFSFGSLSGAVALFVYASGFSFAYISMSTGTGALILFGSVQLTMLVWGFFHGERFSLWQWLGLGAAVAGLVVLLLPGLSAPPMSSAALMTMAGIGWGAYSLLGRAAGAPLAMTAGNFLFTVPLAVVLHLALAQPVNWQSMGVACALLSGVVTSGLGYAIWYRVVKFLAASQAATVQLSVPVLAMLLGWVFLGEVISGQMLLASACILGGIGLVINRRKAEASK
ncbi:DMT family transporter [Alteromonas aestuariivivens]|uniref:DMT family transporter n=1 Tax=Alteromonas aestuariivivens TaxID=1938339 RepID=A0A3D8MB35_9ALTE|nr:DMT family transporter [Alteromonas aestuariivivens]RDV27315.1 DMT family transporter [Alteromonas aestuariivivens]